MKTRKMLLFSVANLIAFFTIWDLAERVSQKERFGSKYRTNSFIMSDTIDCNAPVRDVYQFYIHHYDEVYPKTAEKHHEFKLLNSDSIAAGTEIFCREGEVNDMIYHQYLVNEVIPNSLIYKSSEPSVVYAKTKKGLTKRTCNAHVYVEFFEVSEAESRIAFTIVIQMPNYFYKLAGRLVGGKRAKEEWEGHLKEELTGFIDNYKTFGNPAFSEIGAEAGYWPANANVSSGYKPIDDSI